MKRVGGLFEQFCHWDNLQAAYRKARRGSRQNIESLAFFHRLEQELFQLQDEITALRWQPQPYRYFDIFDPKHRTISVAAFRDRVVHHALVGVLEPVYERRFISDSYATRKGKGVHLAVLRAQKFLQQSEWFFKSDVEKYFDSIRHDILLGQLERTIKDQRLLQIAERIVRNGGGSGCGLPIGNLTSQFFANVYLNSFDHFVKQELRVRQYVRYMDDFVLFSPDKEFLKSLREPIEHFLKEKLALQLKPSATYFNSALNGLSFLGCRVFPSVIRLRPENLQRILGRVRQREHAYRIGELAEATFQQSMNSYWAMLSYYPEVKPLRRALLA